MKSKLSRAHPFAYHPVAAGCALLVLLNASSALAQQADPAQSVTVTGIRRGIESAISVKKSSDSIVEAISAEDLGKLPDNSIAESIARLPGLAVQRVNGRAQEVSIRGLSGDFATTLLNGREQASSGDNRSAQFDAYPTELIGGVTIYKTPDSLLAAQGLAGTADLQTVKPLGYGNRIVTVSARNEKSAIGIKNGKGTGSRFSASYVDQFANRTVGVALGLARFDSTADSTTRQGDYSDVTVNGQTVSAPTHWKIFSNHRKETRDGAMGTVEFKPSDDLYSRADIFYSNNVNKTDKKGIEATTNGTWAGGCNPNCVLSNATVVGGKVDSGTWSNGNNVLANDVDSNSAKLTSLGWNTRWKPAKGWAVVADLSHSTAQRKESPYETWAGVPGGAHDNVSFTGGAGGLPNLVLNSSVHYDDPSIVKLMDAAGWGIDGYLKKLQVNDVVNAYKFSAEKDLPEGLPFSRVHFGVNLGQRSKDRDVPEWALHLINGPTQTVPNASSVLAGDSTVRMISYDALALEGKYRHDFNTYWDINLKKWKVDERTATPFVKLDVDTQLGSVPVRGNLGLQIARTEQSSTGTQVDLTVGNDNNHPVTTYTTGVNYTNVLPSLNLVFDIGQQQVVRLGVARTMARPRMDQMSASVTAGVNTSAQGGPRWEGDGGNPKLRPWLADAVDVSYEKYFGNKAYVGAAAFYKDLKSYIYKYQNEQFDFTGFHNASNVVPASTIGIFNQFQNGSGGKLSGVELTASLPLDLLTNSLRGFGVSANYNVTESSIKPFGNGDTRPLPGLSKTTSNFTGYYEANGLSLRVARRYRSDFLGEITGFASNRYFQYIKAEAVTDLQVGYELQSGPAKGLSMLLQVNNLGDAKYQEYQNTPDNITNSTKYGKTIYAGVTYKF